MENVIQVRNEYRKQQWMQIIRECQNSGLSNKEYCRQNGISEKTYYYWLRKLRTKLVPADPKEQRIQELEKEKRELQRANEILQEALGFFAKNRKR